MVVLWFFIMGVILATFFLVLNNQREKTSFQETGRISKGEKISCSPLNLETLEFPKTFETFYEKDLSKTLLFLGKNSRPDAREDQTNILVGLKGSKQSQLVNPGEKFYLAYQQGDLVFSKEQTSLWIKIKDIVDNTLQFDAAFILTNDETNDIYQEKLHQTKELTTEEEFEDTFLQSTYFQSLESAKWWLPDLFYEVYGGQEFESVKGAQRLEFLSQNPSVCFLKSKTVLIFKEGAWCLYDNKGATEQYPIAEVLTTKPSHMEVKVWDVSGMHSRVISFLPERTKPLNIKAEEVFSNIRQRTATQVSCKIGSKSSLLKKGEWLLKVGSHWKPLKAWEEIEKYLSFQLQGELFVFDGIEKNQGITVFKGHLFDTMREQMQVIRIPLPKQKKSSIKRKKHKELGDFEEQTTLSEDSNPRLEEEDKEALLRLTTPQKHHGFSKQI